MKISIPFFLPILFSLLLFPSCGSNPQDLSDQEVIDIAKDAYLFGMPLVVMELTKQASTYPAGGTSTPFNRIRHIHQFPDHEFRRVVKPNLDTFYSSAFLDLKEGPLVLKIPMSPDRYFLCPIMDAWTNIIASPGTRTTGDSIKTYLLAGPEWEGEVPEDMELIRSGTQTAWLLNRVQVNSLADAHEIAIPFMDQFELYPQHISVENPEIKLAKKETPGELPPPPSLQVQQMDIADYFNLLNALLEDNPPYPTDQKMVDRIAQIGIGAGKSFSLDNFGALTAFKLQQMPGVIFDRLKNREADPDVMSNHWVFLRDQLGDYGENYPLRAAVSLLGFGANLTDDAVYPNTKTDSEGNQLHGENQYVLHFPKDQLPPVNAFWSITPYNAENFLMKNAGDRYAIGDRDDLVYEDDGSLNIYIQAEPPEDDKESNWLPVGEGPFSLTMRLYWPKNDALDGTWQVPVVKRVND